MYYSWSFRVGCTVVSTDHGDQYIRQTTLYLELYRVLLCHLIQELCHCLILRALIHNTILLLNHIISTLLESRHANNFSLHCFFLENMTTRQQLKTKSSIVDTNNYLNGIFLYFDFVNSEFSSDFRLINNFFSYFFFIKQATKIKKAKPLIFVISTIYSQIHQQIPNLSLLFLMLILEILLLYLSLISILILMMSRRQFIMLLILLQLRLNSLLSDMGLTKLSKFQKPLISLLLIIQINVSLILQFILINYNQLL